MRELDKIRQEQLEQERKNARYNKQRHAYMKGKKDAANFKDKDIDSTDKDTEPFYLMGYSYGEVYGDSSI